MLFHEQIFEYSQGQIYGMTVKSKLLGWKFNRLEAIMKNQLLQLGFVGMFMTIVYTSTKTGSQQTVPFLATLKGMLIY